MKRFALAALVVLCCLAVASAVFAGQRKHVTKEMYFGDSFHKSPAGIKITYFDLTWNEQGATMLGFELSSWKGHATWDDVYIVGTKDGKQYIVHKFSSKMKLGLEFCILDCPGKLYRDNFYFAPPYGPFDGDTGQIWWVFHYGPQSYHVIWDIKTNDVKWYKAQDKPAPPELSAAAPVPPAPPAATEQPPAPPAAH